MAGIIEEDDGTEPADGGGRAVEINGSGQAKGFSGAHAVRWEGIRRGCVTGQQAP